MNCGLLNLVPLVVLFGDRALFGPLTVAFCTAGIDAELPII
jgi:hypothetical protein